MTDVTKAIRQLERAQKNEELALIQLHDSIRPNESNEDQKRNSGVSDASTADEIENATPTSLQAELMHYKELFSKLRFSYVEQVTKEKFLRAITDNPPLLVEHQENVELEANLEQSKAALKTQKIAIANLIAELEAKAGELGERYESLRLQTAQLSKLPSEVASLEASVENLRTAQAADPANPSCSLPLAETQTLLANQENELSHLDNQIAMLQASIPRKTKELDRLERELEPLETQKNGVVTAAKEARRRRDEGVAGMGDALEQRGRWLRAVDKGLIGMLGVEG